MHQPHICWPSDNPLVSINITTYNRKYLLERCLTSIYKQSYKNYEIIIIDDCSSDNTEELVHIQMKKNSKIKYFRNLRNRGNAYSRNYALNKSSGFFVAFMDDDDTWEDIDKLKKQKEFLKKNKDFSLCYTGINIYRNNNFFKKKYVKTHENLDKLLLARNGIIYSPTVMTYKKIMIKVGGFDEKIKRGVDSDFYRNCLLNHQLKFGCIEYPTTNIYENIPQSIKNHKGVKDQRFKMTNANTIKDLSIIYQMHLYTIKKYFRFYISSPYYFFLRAKQLIKSFCLFIYLIFKKI